MERERLARKNAKSVTDTDQPTLFGCFLRQRKCSDEDVGLNRPTTPEDKSFPNRTSAEDESTNGESDIVIIEDPRTSNATEENIQSTTNT